MLGRRDYTANELTARLTERGYEPPDVAAALETLASERFLDDARAARAHVRTASRVKGRGRLRIRRELEARGIDADIALDALAEISPEDEAEAIARLLSRQREALESPEGRDRLFRKLLRRGFSADAIAKALKARR
jgi:regulatory protein